MIISTWQKTSNTQVKTVGEKFWESLGQFKVTLGTADVYLTLQEIINLKRQISDAERVYFDDHVYGKETA